jgi:hypothetical protein
LRLAAALALLLLAGLGPLARADEPGPVSANLDTGSELERVVPVRQKALTGWDSFSIARLQRTLPLSSVLPPTATKR